MSMSNAEITVILGKAVAALSLMADWMAVTLEGPTVVSGPELVADAGVRGIPTGVVGTVVAVTGIWAVTRATFCITWSLVD
jgi:hypothetical protein